MFLRESAKEFDANCVNGGAGNRARLKSIIEAGDEPGLLAYEGPKAVGWVAVAPREEYGRVLRSPLHKPIDDQRDVWAVTCFFIAKSTRGEGVADALLLAAVDHARRGGAKVVEAYPNDVGGARAPAADMWRGSVTQFERAGFEVAARRKPARPIVRKFV
jgi:GNAT superfamily N-acetyltransferase